VQWRNPLRGWSTDFFVCLFSFFGPSFALFWNDRPWWGTLYWVVCLSVLYAGVCSRNNSPWNRPWAAVAGIDLDMGPVNHWMDIADGDNAKNRELLGEFPAWRYAVVGTTRVRFLCRDDALMFKLSGDGIRLLAPSPR
jgi:hypothetical protein